MEELLEIAKKAFPPVDGSLELMGIIDKIEILWDNWGIPHIFAKSIEDAYFAQGYVHAHHRLWQMEIFRRLTTGELSELIGEATLDSDKHYKIIGLHRIAKNSVEKLSEKKDSKVLYLLESYVKGVNVGIEEARINPPIEFVVLDLKLRDWNLEDSLKIISIIEWGLSNWAYPLELLREHLIGKLGHEMADKLIPLYEGTNVSESLGSNGWVISPSKSDSGAVLFANDPHLPLTLPAIWFFVHLNCPELNTIGSSFPGLPSIVLGHNEKIAWGCTNVGADTIDLFKLELNPENDHQYRYNSQWVDFDVIDDPITIKNKDNLLPFQVLVSKFGPVVEYFEKDRKFYKINLPDKYAMRWTSSEANLFESLEGFMKVNKASNWAEFQDGLKLLTINPQNFIYGDKTGNIGLQHGGKIPIRKYGNGAMVSPGTDQKYDWKNLSSFEDLLSIYNPRHGFVYTANYNEDKAPNGLLIGQDTIEPYRQMRLKNLLQSKEKFSIQDFKDMQLDYYTEEASELLPIMLDYLKSSDLLEKYSNILLLLKKWDYNLIKKSVAGTIYKIWHQETLKAILIPHIGEELLEPFLGSRPFDLKRLFKLFDNNQNELEELLFNSLQDTINFLSEKLNSDYSKWEWGNLHKLTLVHPFSLANEDGKALNIGPFKMGGDSNTLNNGYFDPFNDYAMAVGPSFRQIHDLSDWDKSVFVLPGGQTGLPFHKHYKDLMKFYVKGKYIPLLFSREAILNNLEGVFKISSKN